VAQGSTLDVDSAVRAARAALPAWQSLTPHARARYLYALARQVQKQFALARRSRKLDNGKPIRESRDIDIPLVTRLFITMRAGPNCLSRNFRGYNRCAAS